LRRRLLGVHARGGNRSPAGYDASYSRGAVRYNDPSYRQAAYGPAGAFEAPVQRGMWSGVKQVSRKAEWPAWTPPPEMLRRRPDLPRHMEGGPANPLGARALYLGSSLYRIHGTNEPSTIGQNVSSAASA